MLHEADQLKKAQLFLEKLTMQGYDWIYYSQKKNFDSFKSSQYYFTCESEVQIIEEVDSTLIKRPRFGNK